MTREQARERILTELGKQHWSVIIINDILSKLESDYKAPDKASLIQLAAESCKTHPVSITALSEKGKLNRKRENVIARQLVCHELLNQGYTYERAGKVFGYDHSTVIHCKKAIEQGLEWNDPLIKEPYERFKELINENCK